MVDPLLNQWLSTATAGLSKESVEKVELEITQHFLDAFAHQKEQGLSEPEAIKKVMGDLGSPFAARREFAKVYTLSYEKQILSKIEAGLTLEERWYGFAPLAFGLLFFWIDRSALAVLLMALGITIIAEPWLRKALTRIWSRKHVGVVFAFLASVETFSILMIPSITLRRIDSTFDQILAGIGLILTVFFFASRISIFRQFYAEQRSNQLFLSILPFQLHGGYARIGRLPPTAATATKQSLESDRG